MNEGEKKKRKNKIGKKGKERTNERSFVNISKEEEGRTNERTSKKKEGRGWGTRGKIRKKNGKEGIIRVNAIQSHEFRWI